MLFSYMNCSREQRLGGPVGTKMTSHAKQRRDTYNPIILKFFIVTFSLIVGKPWNITFIQLIPPLCNKFNDSLYYPFSWLLDLITYSWCATMQGSYKLQEFSSIKKKKLQQPWFLMVNLFNNTKPLPLLLSIKHRRKKLFCWKPQMGQ